MYTAFYGLREKPFSLTPNPRYLFLSESHREALAHLLFGIDEDEGFIAITGEVGTGKTTLCRTLIERLGSGTEVAYLFNPSRSPTELLHAVLSEFSLTASGNRNDLITKLNEFLLQKKREGRRVLLIVDEAQNLSTSTLEQIRLLSNLETSSSKLIQILLLGQPELDRLLDSRALRQLRQRISVRWSLGPMTARETRAYVRHRLRIAAGSEQDIFSQAALRAIYRRAGGVPRLVNVLCDRALLAGYGSRARTIGPALVRRSVRETLGPQRRLGALRRLAWPAAFSGAVLVGLASLAIFGSERFGWTGIPSLLFAPPVVASAPPPASPAAFANSVGTGERAAPAGALLPSSSALRPQPNPGDLWDFGEPLALPALSEGDLAMARFAESPLARILDSQSAESSRWQAINAALAAYDLPPAEAAPESEAQALALLEERGLELLPLERADLVTLEVARLPVLLQLRTDSGDLRMVTVGRIEGSICALFGAAQRGTLLAPLQELKDLWDGRAHVVISPREPAAPEALREAAG